MQKTLHKAEFITSRNRTIKKIHKMLYVVKRRKDRFFTKFTFPPSAPATSRSKSIIFIFTCHLATVYGKVHFPPRETTLLFGNFSREPLALFVPPVALFRARRFITRRGTLFPFFYRQR